MILGFGPLVANSVGPILIEQTFNQGGVVDFRSLFLVACGTAVAGAVTLALFFPPPAKKVEART